MRLVRSRRRVGRVVDLAQCGRACAVARPGRAEWLDAVAREHGVLHASLSEALTAYVA